MEMKEIKKPEKKETKESPVYEPPGPELNIDSEQFPDIKGMGTRGAVKMIIEGMIARFSSDDKGKENYTIRIKKAGVEKKDSRQIKAVSPAEEETEGE